MPRTVHGRVRRCFGCEESANSFADPHPHSQVITGATDGIGREFVRQLSKAGFNIVLVSRSTEKLTAGASEIGEDAHGPVLNMYLISPRSC